MRLIDADDILPMMERKMDMQDLYLPIHFQEMVIDEMPTVDAVPVVLCKDCEFYGEDGDSVMDGIYKRCSICGKWHTGSWYCASGERKSNEAY